MRTRMRKQKKMAAPIEIQNGGLHGLDLIPIGGGHLGISAEFRKFGNSGLHISAPRAPTAKKLIYSESVDQSHSNAPQLVHFGQVLGKLNFSPVPPSPVANMRRKKKNLTYSESVDPARQYQMAFVKILH